MAILHLLDRSKYTTSEQQQDRLEHCHNCEHLTKYSKQCKKCGCFVAAKTKLKTEKCPIGLWKEIR